MFRCHPREMCWRPAQTSRWQLGEKLSWWMPRLTKKPGGRVGGSTKRSSLLYICYLKGYPSKVSQSITIHRFPRYIRVGFMCSFGSSRSWAVEISEAEKELDYKPTTSLQDGINKFIAWYLGSALDEADADWCWWWWWWWSCDLPVFSCIPLGKDKAWLKTIFPPGGAGQGPRFILKWICTYIIR